MLEGTQMLGEKGWCLGLVCFLAGEKEEGEGCGALTFRLTGNKNGRVLF